MITPQVKENKVIFGPCRLSYTHVFNRYNPDGDQADGKYMTNVLIPKDEKETIEAINKAIAEAKKQAIVSKWGGKEPKKLDMPLRDGDEKDDENYEGHLFVNAKSNTRPGIVDRKKVPIVDEEEVYSGVWAIVSVTFFGYDKNGNKGVACGLNNIMKFKDDEHFGGRVSAESDFGDVDLGDDDDDL
ncbi:MAG: DUF2815 family protein [Paludibacteraceae bacterium]|jgi:hypothetical protein|nr:DUF2815 family protein [Paludibacteraceae bacterium]